MQGQYLWQRLAEETRPIVLYGMGDGADKILAQCRRYTIPVAGVFASDDFVRGQDFQGYRVETLAQLESRLGSLVVLLCFASQRPEVLKHIKAVAERHTLLVPDVPVWGDTLFTPQLVEELRPQLETLESLLGDEQSRLVLHNVIQAKLTGEPQYLWDCETPRQEVLDQVLRFGPDESYVDAGAYTGDTVEEFLRQTGGKFRRILALEPDRRNFRRLSATVESLKLPGITCIHTGVWSHRDTLCFNHRSGRQAAFTREGEGDTPVDSIDNLLAGDAATYIKLDVEGAEREALLGSRDTIARHRPKLAVALYHRSEDLFTLPALIYDLCPHYRLYLRHHPYLPAWETNCYAICP